MHCLVFYQLLRKDARKAREVMKTRDIERIMIVDITEMTTTEMKTTETITTEMITEKYMGTEAVQIDTGRSSGTFIL